MTPDCYFDFHSNKIRNKHDIALDLLRSECIIPVPSLCDIEGLLQVGTSRPFFAKPVLRLRHLSAPTIVGLPQHRHPLALFIQRVLRNSQAFHGRATWWLLSFNSCFLVFCSLFCTVVFVIYSFGDLVFKLQSSHMLKSVVVKLTSYAARRRYIRVTINQLIN